MKSLVFSFLILLGMLGVFHAPDNLTSTTMIEPNKSFVLGEGKHGDYNAKIVNKGPVEVEIFTQVEDEAQKSIGVLKPKDKNQFYIGKNTKAIFKNLGAEKAVLGIVLTGETSLSMGYKDNPQ